MAVFQSLLALMRQFQWRRGLRAAFCIGSAMIVCHLFNKPPAAAALGAFDALLVDNGGPYRTRLNTMLTVLLAGAGTYILGALLPPWIALVLLTTAAVCFFITFARVVSQPLASTSVLIIVLFFAGLGGSLHNPAGVIGAVELIFAGGAWAMLLSLLFWPLDPFRPARLAVAQSYTSLGTVTALIGTAEDGAEHSIHEARHRQRLNIEAAHAALTATHARAPSRTSRARNLSVLLETADMLLARSVRLTELAEVATDAGSAEVVAGLGDLARWLAAAETAIASALAHKPADDAASFARDGSTRLQFIRRRREQLQSQTHTVAAPSPDSLEAHLASEQQAALLEIEVAFDAVRAIWTGTEAPAATNLPLANQPSEQAGVSIQSSALSGMFDALRANWTLSSTMFRHALRLMVVGAVDVTVMRLIHINHGFWLPMTSIILLQPYSAGTVRKTVQRVTGTVAGGILAAILAAAVPNQFVMTGVLITLVFCTLSTFAVDYAVFVFFLTPTFVLLSLPHPHDWRYAGIRIGTTLAGALIALLAMRLLWPERAEDELGRLLRRGAAADAAYLRATLHFWAVPAQQQRLAERDILAPARRACGLASNDAEEAVDRVMQEPHLGLRARDKNLTLPQQALTFATYLRRLTQSITALAALGRDTPPTHARLEAIARRLDHVASAESAAAIEGQPLQTSSPASFTDVAAEQMERIERQTAVLERTALALLAQ